MGQLLEYSAAGTAQTDEIVACTENVAANRYRGQLLNNVNANIEGADSATYGVWTAASKGGSRKTVLLAGYPSAEGEVSIDTLRGFVYAYSSQTVYVRYLAHGPVYFSPSGLRVPVSVILATPLGPAYGGTGLASYTIGDLIYASGATALAKLADVAVGQYLASGGVGAAPAWAALNAAAVGLGSVENTALSTWAGSTNLTTLGTVATGAWNATAISAPKGGTGQTTYVIGDLLYASATNALSKLAGVATGSYLASGGIGAAPTWTALNAAAVGLGNVENTALSTWAGTVNVVTTGKIGTYDGVATAGQGHPAIRAAVVLSEQSAEVGANLAGTNVVGFYRISRYLRVTTADTGSPMPTVKLQFTYADGTGTKTINGTALDMSAVGAESGTFVARVASGQIAWAAVVTDAITDGRFAVDIVAERII